MLQQYNSCCIALLFPDLLCGTVYPLHFLTAGQCICGLPEGILRAINSLNNNNMYAL